MHTTAARRHTGDLGAANLGFGIHKAQFPVISIIRKKLIGSRVDIVVPFLIKSGD